MKMPFRVCSRRLQLLLQNSESQRTSSPSFSTSQESTRRALFFCSKIIWRSGFDSKLFLASWSSPPLSLLPSSLPGSQFLLPTKWRVLLSFSSSLFRLHLHLLRLSHLNVARMQIAFVTCSNVAFLFRPTRFQSKNYRGSRDHLKKGSWEEGFWMVLNSFLFSVSLVL